MIALAAKELSVPVVCVTGLFKLAPVYRHDQVTTIPTRICFV